MNRLMTRPLRLSLLLAAAGAMAAAPASVAAQEDPLGEPLDDANCPCLESSLTRMAPNMARLAPTMAFDRRAHLGVMLGPETEAAGQPGVELAEVPEGMPARRAGLRAGDVVVALDGVALGEDATHTLLERMEGVEPGDTVTVSYIRDGEERSARVETEAASSFRFFGRDGRVRAPDFREVRIRSFPGQDGVRVRGPEMLSRLLRRDGLELAEVNPELGRYFGTDRGVLVVEIDEDSPLGLRPGDVILEIGGREVADVRHARSILASYRADEEVPLRIVRDERTIDVTGRSR